MALVPGDEDGIGIAEAAGGDAVAPGEDLIEGEGGGAEGGLEADGVGGENDGELGEFEQLSDAADSAEEDGKASADDDCEHEGSGGEAGMDEGGLAAGGKEKGEEPAEEVGKDGAESDEAGAAKGEEDLHAVGGAIDAGKGIGRGGRHGSLLFLFCATRLCAGGDGEQ